MSKRQKGSLVILALGLAAVAVDRFAVLPGPSSAEASASVESSVPSVDLGVASRLAEQLTRSSEPSGSVLLAEAVESPEFFEAFGSLRRPQPEPGVAAETPAIEGSGPVRSPSRLPVLSAIVLTDSGGYAVLNGRPMGVGAGREGFTLVDLSARSATIAMDGVRVTLSLAGERGGTQESP